MNDKKNKLFDKVDQFKAQAAQVKISLPLTGFKDARAQVSVDGNLEIIKSDGDNIFICELDQITLYNLLSVKYNRPQLDVQLKDKHYNRYADIATRLHGDSFRRQLIVENEPVFMINRLRDQLFDLANEIEQLENTEEK